MMDVYCKEYNKFNPSIELIFTINHIFKKSIRDISIQFVRIVSTTFGDIICLTKQKQMK